MSENAQETRNLREEGYYILIAPATRYKGQCYIVSPEGVAEEITIIQTLHLATEEKLPVLFVSGDNVTAYDIAQEVAQEGELTIA